AGYFEQALSALPHLPETRATREQAIDLRFALRSALQPSGDLGRMLVCLREAEALAETFDDPHRLARIALFLSRYCSLMGTYDQPTPAAQRPLALARARGDCALHAPATPTPGPAYAPGGDYRRAIACCREAVTPLGGGGRRERFGRVILPAV